MRSTIYHLHICTSISVVTSYTSPLYKPGCNIWLYQLDPGTALHMKHLWSLRKADAQQRPPGLCRVLQVNASGCSLGNWTPAGSQFSVASIETWQRRNGMFWGLLRDISKKKTKHMLLLLCNNGLWSPEYQQHAATTINIPGANQNGPGDPEVHQSRSHTQRQSSDIKQTHQGVVGPQGRPHRTNGGENFRSPGKGCGKR